MIAVYEFGDSASALAVRRLCGYGFWRLPDGGVKVGEGFVFVDGLFCGPERLLSRNGQAVMRNNEAVAGAAGEEGGARRGIVRAFFIGLRVSCVCGYLVDAAAVIGPAGDAGENEDVHGEKTEKQLHRRKDRDFAIGRVAGGREVSRGDATFREGVERCDDMSFPVAGKNFSGTVVRN